MDFSNETILIGIVHTHSTSTSAKMRVIVSAIENVCNARSLTNRTKKACHSYINFILSKYFTRKFTIFPTTLQDIQYIFFKIIS